MIVAGMHLLHVAKMFCTLLRAACYVQLLLFGPRGMLMHRLVQSFLANVQAVACGLRLIWLGSVRRSRNRQTSTQLVAQLNTYITIKSQCQVYTISATAVCLRLYRKSLLQWIQLYHHQSEPQPLQDMMSKSYLVVTTVHAAYFYDAFQKTIQKQIVIKEVVHRGSL